MGAAMTIAGLWRYGNWRHVATGCTVVVFVRMETSLLILAAHHNHVRTTITATTVLQPFIRDYPGEPVPEETYTHSPILIIIQPLSHL